MKNKGTTLILTVFCFLSTPKVFAGDFKTELKNQLIGGLIGSAIGAGAGAVVAAAGQNELSDLRKYLTYPLYGQSVGNSFGHFIRSKDKSPFPLLLSLSCGLLATALIAGDDSKKLDGPYYRTVRPYGGYFTFYTSLLLYQPIITTASHVLWPKSNTAVSLNMSSGNLQGIVVHQSF